MCCVGDVMQSGSKLAIYERDYWTAESGGNRKIDAHFYSLIPALNTVSNRAFCNLVKV